MRAEGNVVQDHATEAGRMEVAVDFGSERRSRVPCGLALGLTLVCFATVACDSHPVDVGDRGAPAAVAEGILSDPLSVGPDAIPLELSARPAASVALRVDGDEVAYVSTAPGTVPRANRVVVSNARRGFVDTTDVLDGGFDPHPVPASAGDTLTLRFLDRTSEIADWVHVVPARTPPVVVRTNPPRGKRDVPVALSPMVVFSEPMAPRTLEPSSIALWELGPLGAVWVPGTAEFADPAQLTAQFVPSSPLKASTEYLLIVSGESLDLDGDLVASEEQVAFITEASLAPAVSLAFSGHGRPTHTIAGLRMGHPLTVIAVDPVGREVPLGSRTVTLSIGANPSGGQLLGSTSATWTSRGLYGLGWHNLSGAHFDDVRIDRAGVGYTLIASTSCLQSAESPMFDVVAPTDLITFDSPFGLSVASADGHGVARLLGNIGHAASAWSPDGTKLVTGWGFVGYGYMGPDPRALQVMNADGSAPRLIGEGGVPAWSPDGTTIAFVTGLDMNQPHLSEIYVRSSNGSGATRLGHGIHPAWSPDGLEIAFTRDSAVFSMNRDGTGVRRLADAADFSRPAWSPDGTKIAFSCAETYNLCLMNPDGSGITEVGISDTFRSDYPCEAHPSWSPDGTRIAFVGECSEFWPSPIVVVDLVTGETTIIAGPIPPGPGPQFTVSLFWPAWRPIS
jgi:hypothetical protein